jgi:multiple sugar transport system permease protein
MTYLIALTVNLAATLVIYSLMAFALVRLRWHRHGTVAVIIAIVVAGQFWIVPTLLVRSIGGAAVTSHSLSFCNWLISGFSIIVLGQAVRWIPRQLEDSARLDGCGWFAIYWHVLLPFIRRELALIAASTALGTSILLLGLLEIWNATGVVVSLRLDLMMGASLAATLLVIVVFLFVRAPLMESRERVE